MKPKNHSAISERNQKAQAPSQSPASPTPCDNDNLPKGHSQFRQAVKDHQANGLKKCRARLNWDSIVLVDEKTDKSAAVRWFFFAFPQGYLGPATEL